MCVYLQNFLLPPLLEKTEIRSTRAIAVYTDLFDVIHYVLLTSPLTTFVFAMSIFFFRLPNSSSVTPNAAAIERFLFDNKNWHAQNNYLLCSIEIEMSKTNVEKVRITPVIVFLAYGIFGDVKSMLIPLF